MKLQTVTVEEVKKLDEEQIPKTEVIVEDKETEVPAIEAEGKISEKKRKMIQMKTDIAEKNVYEEVVAKDLAPNEAAMEKRGGYLTVNVVAKVKGV
ncbi:hypothetical protein L1887_14311 [Cichorium endivia]|nr:hypothetical protein L1887_14311 [Cichorium endivia]